MVSFDHKQSTVVGWLESHLGRGFVLATLTPDVTGVGLRPVSEPPLVDKAAQHLTRRSHKRSRRRAMGLLFLPLIAFLIGRRPVAGAHPEPLEQSPLVMRKGRLLVLSPHPDDAALSAAGFLPRAAR